MKILETGLAAVGGFRMAGIHSGIKKAKKDIALIVSDCPATAAGAFTRNRVKAAPVQYDMELIAGGGPAGAILINSGNANACTGAQGMADTRAMAAHAASALGLDSPESVYVCSTGVIGVPLPMPVITEGIREAAGRLACSRQAAIDAAEAILTTDTFIKEIAVEVEIDGKPVRIAGIAKGSGMIHPDMATLLSFIITDAAVPREMLQGLLGDSITHTYNMISVDGDTSTNDTVLVLANGCSGVTVDSDTAAVFAEAFDHVHAYLSQQIVRDGEGAGKFITATVTGATDIEGARRMAKSIITSNLVKTAIFGEDANWGRILCAMGYSGADFNPDTVNLSIGSKRGSMRLLEAGTPIPFSEEYALELLQEHDIDILAELHDGEAAATAWGCDLSYEYVRINGEYRS